MHSYLLLRNQNVKKNIESCANSTKEKKNTAMFSDSAKVWFNKWNKQLYYILSHTILQRIPKYHVSYTVCILL